MKQIISFNDEYCNFSIERIILDDENASEVFRQHLIKRISELLSVSISSAEVIADCGRAHAEVENKAAVIRFGDNNNEYLQLIDLPQKDDVKRTRKKEIEISASTVRKMHKYLSGEEYLPEDVTISFTADFGDGYEMDIKVCGVQEEEDSDNSAWSEAVLFHNGSEVCCTEPSDEFLGEWTCEDADGNKYIATVKVKEEFEEKLEVMTTAGVLKAYKSCDPGQPGICVMLKPAGYDVEVDLSYISVYEDEEYRTKDHEENTDVCIMTYADIYSEDYTSKNMIRRKDVVSALKDCN